MFSYCWRLVSRHRVFYIAMLEHCNAAWVKNATHPLRRPLLRVFRPQLLHPLLLLRPPQSSQLQRSPPWPSMNWCWFWMEITSFACICVMYNIFGPYYLSKLYWWIICIIRNLNITNLDFSFLKYELVTHHETMNILESLYILFPEY